MNNPVMTEVTRGGRVESFHRGSFAVVDGDGTLVISAGDIERPVFPRSSVKLIQALPLIETGAADRLKLGDRELALSQASHCGEKGHTELAAQILEKAGFGEADLECGPQWPGNHEAHIDLARSGNEPSQLHNNCSGKHAGFLCVCGHCGIDAPGYVEPEHRFQQMLRDVMTDVTGYPHRADDCGRDGCSIPTYPVPLKNLAAGFARLATGNGIAAERARAAKRLMNAAMTEPWYVDGTDRTTTRIMETAKGRIFAKPGAEGMFCAAIPEMGYGIALKIDDGAERAIETAMPALLARLMAQDAELSAKLTEMASTPILNRRGIAVGEMRPAD